METYYEAKPGLVDKSAVALGFFDGVHPGHRSVIQKALDDAKRLGIKSGVVTFKDHPRSLTRGRSPMLLTVIEQRLNLLKELGVDFALVLAFTEELCLLSPREYVENILVNSIGSKSISVGHNHHFGKDREGDANLLASMGKSLDFTVNVANMVTLDGEEVSSSRIRHFIENGMMQKAANLLQRPFSVLGEVEHGDGRGKEIGFPTANLDVYEYQMLPKRGVYVGRARLASKEVIGCVINVGLRPTFETKQSELTIEAHLIDHFERLYGQNLEIEFLDFLRDEKKFASKEELVEQIQRDKETSINYLEKNVLPGNNLLDKEEKLHA